MLSSLGGITIPAVYRLIAAGLKWDFCLFVALSTGCGKHLARTSIVTAAVVSGTLCSTSGTASGTTLGFIGEAFSSEELLLFRGKGERFSAIGTSEGFFCVSQLNDLHNITRFNQGSSNAFVVETVY